MTIDFKNIKVKDLDGNEMIYDVSKSLGNFIYKVTPDLGMFQFAQSMYNNGIVEMSDELKRQLVEILSLPQCPFIAIVKQKIIDILSQSSNENHEIDK